MQAASDIFLGWQRVLDVDGQTRDYYVRQLHDWKGSAEEDTFRVPGATLYARMCGLTLARAHARSGDRIAIASYLGKGDVFDRAIADFSAAYAEQNERDYQEFASAVRSGRVMAVTGGWGLARGVGVFRFTDYGSHRIYIVNTMATGRYLRDTRAHTT